MNGIDIRDCALDASNQSALLARRKAKIHNIIRHKETSCNDSNNKKIKLIEHAAVESQDCAGLNRAANLGLPEIDPQDELTKNVKCMLLSLATPKPPSSHALLLPMAVSCIIDMLRRQFPDASYLLSPFCDEAIVELLKELDSRQEVKLDKVKISDNDAEEALVIVDIGKSRGNVEALPSPKPRYNEILMATNAAHILKLDVRAGMRPELKEVEYVLARKSFKQKQVEDIWADIDELLAKPSAKSQLVNEKFKNKEDVVYREFCEWGLHAECKKRHPLNHYCTKLHFRRIMLPQTDIKLGDCSYLNTCHHMDTCKFVHYEYDEDVRGDIERPLPVLDLGNPAPGQWINCDVRKLDYTILGKFAVIMADPPWDIHMQLPYGTMTDEEMKSMPISVLQDEGYIFLWVTGRAIELGRECLTTWGYERVDELIWVKTNQIQKLIRTGRTGHWLNHSKEHCIIGVKRRADGTGASEGNGKQFNLGIDTDVLVAEVRETSWKPDEIYGLIDRLSPGTRKLEIFGRQHNTRAGWMTLGNQLDGVRICEPEVLERFNAAYPRHKVALATR